MRPLLALLVVLAGGARAQAPVALNALIPRAEAAALPDVALFPAARGADSAVEPDTTRPWRYFPLHVGDAWEYLVYHNSAVIRRVVTRDTIVDGRAYVLLAQYFINGGPPVLSFRNPIRFDSLSALAKEPYGDGSGQEATATYLTPCPLNKAFGASVTCHFGPANVSGGSDGRLVFGGAFPGTGTDTVTYKRFVGSFNTEYRYAADFGFVYSFAGETGTQIGLYFARVNGVAHGVERYPSVPTAAAPLPEPDGDLMLAVAPNPARGRATVSLTLVRAGAVRPDVYDALGRQVLTEDLGTLAAGLHEAPLDLSSLAPGVYVVRATVTAGAAPARVLTRRLTVAR